MEEERNRSLSALLFLDLLCSTFVWDSFILITKMPLSLGTPNHFVRVWKQLNQRGIFAYQTNLNFILMRKVINRSSAALVLKYFQLPVVYTFDRYLSI